MKKQYHWQEPYVYAQFPTEQSAVQVWLPALMTEDDVTLLFDTYLPVFRKTLEEGIKRREEEKSNGEV